MPTFPKFSMAFNIASNNEERIEAFELYKRAFNAKKTWEGTPPDGDDIHISMEINGFNILLAPGEEKGINNVVCCDLHYDNENDLRQGYEILIQEGHDFYIGSYPWAPLGAFVKDKYGVLWWLHT
jgi:uncharacterized glyoxalase superfamily protein PhnB